MFCAIISNPFSVVVAVLAVTGLRTKRIPNRYRRIMKKGVQQRQLSTLIKGRQQNLVHLDCLTKLTTVAEKPGTRANQITVRRFMGDTPQEAKAQEEPRREPQIFR